MSNLTAIDADGHVIEKESEIRKYLKEPWNRRSTALRPGDQPWDNYMFDHFVTERTWSKLSASDQVARWQDILDEHQIETAVCFPTGSGSVVRLQELKFQIAVAQACNDHFRRRVQRTFRSREVRWSFADALAAGGRRGIGARRQGARPHRF